MKVLCPECNQSVVVDDSEKRLHCPHCDLEANLSQIGTSPGVAAASVTRDLSGETLAGYRLIDVIGSGGMGIVYRAEKDGQTVALKILSCESAWKKEAFVSRFKREVKALGRLDHPNIVQILDSGEVEGIHYLVTEYVDGENLAERLKRGPLDSRAASKILLGVLDAIAFAHEKGIVHRDIKPANILLLKNDGVKVLDFGLAQISGGDTVFSTLTRTNLAMGTFNYLSPEQRTNAKSVDARADLFSLGVVLFEMLTGALPLGNFRLPSRVRVGIDKRFDKVVEKSLASDPDDRYESAVRFAGEVRRISTPKRFPMTAAAAMVAALVGGGVAAAWVAGGDSTDLETTQGGELQMMSDSKSRAMNVELETKRRASAQSRDVSAQGRDVNQQAAATAVQTQTALPQAQNQSVDAPVEPPAESKPISKDIKNDSNAPLASNSTRGAKTKRKVKAQPKLSKEQLEKRNLQKQKMIELKRAKKSGKGTTSFASDNVPSAPKAKIESSKSPSVSSSKSGKKKSEKQRK